MPTNKKSSSSRKKRASRGKSKSMSKSKPRSRSASRSKSRSRRSTKHVTRRRGPIVIKPEHPIPIDLNIPRTSRAPMPPSLTPDELKKVS
ncbi:MAG: hypothetical protein WC919_05895, partial [Candidatus Paceibacterota bacterium]